MPPPPGRIWYAAGAAIILCGIVVFVIMIVNGITDLESVFTAYEMPGRHEVVFEEQGVWTVFYEYQTVINGRRYSTPSELPPIQCALAPVESAGEAILMENATLSGHYNAGGRSLVSVGQFAVPTPGKYLFVAQYPNEPGPEIVLALGKGFGGRLVTLVLSGLAVVFFSIAIGGTLIIVTLVRRVNAAKQPAASSRTPVEDSFRLMDDAR